MDNSLLVRLVHSRANLFEDIHHPLQWQSFLLCQDVPERTAIEILHHEISYGLSTRVRETKVSNVNHVRMAQASGGAGLALEARHKFLVAHELGRDQLER